MTSWVAARSEAVAGRQLIRTWDPPGDATCDVVLIHGIGEHTGRYAPTASRLAEAGMRTVAADLIGFGATGGRRAYVEDWVNYLEQIQSLVEATRRGLPLVLLGHSMGGLIALEYALAERPAPDLLVLSAPALSGGVGWQRALAPVLGRLAGSFSLPNLIKGEQLSRDQAVGEAYFSDPLVHTATTAKLGAELFAGIDRTRAAMWRLDLPTFVLHGGQDTIVPPNCTVALGAQPGVERRLYPTLRHEVFNEPEGPEVVSDVIEWIRTQLDRL